MNEALLVATGPVTASTHQILSGVASVVVADDDSEPSLLALAQEARGFIVRGGSRLSAAVIDAAPHLQVIARSGIGVDGVDVGAASRRSIPVVVTPHAGVDAVAEGTLAMLLALVKRLSLLDALVRSGRWSDRDRTEIGDLHGATLGIMGFGRIGRRVGQLASAFGMQLLATDPFVPDLEISDAGARRVSLAELFERSDHLTLHAPLLPETHGIVTAELLQTAGPGAVFLNLSRGGLVESPDALLAALDAAALVAVGLDVFHQEPPDLSHPLYTDERVLLSPHVLGLTVASRERIFIEMSRGIAAVLHGGRPDSVANPEIYEDGRT